MRTKILLEEADLPTHWRKVVADLPYPPALPLSGLAGNRQKPR